MSITRHEALFCLLAVLSVASSRTALARGDAMIGRDLLQRPAPLMFQSSGSTKGSGSVPKHPGSPTGVIIDEHEYMGPLVGEINANGSPVTFAQQQQGMLQHSEVFGRYSAEDAPATLPFDASGNMQPAVQQNPCLSQAQANAAHVGVPLWCSNASNGRRALQQTGGFASAGGSGQAQPTVVDMTNSQLEQEMLGGGSHQDASINPGAGRAGAGNIAHIEQPVGLNAVVVPQPGTPAKVAGGGVSADGGAVSVGKVKGRRLQQHGSFASGGGSSGQLHPTVVDLTNSQLEQEMLGNGPKDASINPGVGGAGIGSIAHIEQPAGVNAVVVPESSTPAKVAGGSVSAGKVLGSAISEGKVKGRRMLGQGGSFSAGGGSGQAQPTVVDMTNSELEREMMGSGPKVAITAIKPGVNGGGGNVGVGSIAHIEQPAGVGAVVVAQPSTPAKVAGGSISAGKVSGSAITAGKLIGRRMLQQGITGSFAGLNAGSAGRSSVAGTNSAAQSGVAVMTDAQLVQGILGHSPHDAGVYNAAAATRQRPH